MYAFATLHRAELTDEPARLVAVLDALAALPLPVLLAMHPRTRAALEGSGHPVGDRGALTIVPAVGYLESLALTSRARLVITDSGGVQREAYWLGVPCITMRTETEWTETVELGWNVLALDLGRLGALVDRPAPEPTKATPYGDGHAAEATVATLAERVRPRA